MKIKTSITIIIVCAFVPIIINWFGHYTLCEKDIIAGDEGDWVAFWGSYGGALLGALVTLFIVWREGKINTLNLMIQRQEAYINELETELSEHISVFDFVYLGEVALYDRNELHSLSSHYIHELNKKHKDTTMMYNKWIWLHTETSEYNNQFENCSIEYMRLSTLLTVKLHALQSGALDIQSFHVWLTSFCKKTTDAKKSCLEPLADTAQRLIKHELQKYSDMKLELSAFMPEPQKFIT